MSLVAMAFLFTGSQIPVYLFGMLVLEYHGSCANGHQVEYLHKFIVTSVVLTDGCGLCWPTYSLLLQFAPLSEH